MESNSNIKPIISVIIPVYNTKDYLPCCISSVLKQTFTNFEVLLIDDGSTDSSGVICDDYSKRDVRIRVFHKKNGGVSSARNLGISKVRGEWICFLDSDDWLEPSTLSELYRKATEEKAQLVFVDIKCHYPSEQSRMYKIYRWKGKPQDALVDYLEYPRLCPAWGIVNTSLLMNVQNRFPENLTIYEDFHLLIRLVCQSSAITQVEEPLYNYRMQDSSIVHSTSLDRKIKDQEWAYNSILNYFEEIGKYNKYAPALYARILYDYQHMALNPSMHAMFSKLYPEKKTYIWQSRTINVKLKIIMWCLTHHLSFVAYLLCQIRNVYKSIIRNNEYIA